jgi:hypothetical protein
MKLNCKNFKKKHLLIDQKTIFPFKEKKIKNKILIN